MDQRPLVTEQIEAGTEFIDQFDEVVPVSVAFWLKATDGGRWYLYVASDKIDDHTIKAANGEVLRVARELGNPNLDQFQVKLIGSSNPLARAAFEVQRRFVRRVPTRLHDGSFGGMSVEGVYLYPSFSSGGEDARWRGISVNVWPEPKPEGAYRVEFWPRESAASVLPGGQPKRVSRPAGVLVKEGQVIEYRPPEKTMPHLSQGDYEKKALEAVEQVGAKRD